MISDLRIENLSNIVNPEGRSDQATRIQSSPASADNQSDGFTDMLTQSINKVNQMQKDADQAIKQLVAGKTKNVHETMLAIERADVSLKLMMQVRNKVIDAYREIMRMQV